MHMDPKQYYLIIEERYFCFLFNMNETLFVFSCSLLSEHDTLVLWLMECLLWLMENRNILKCWLCSEIF